MLDVTSLTAYMFCPRKLFLEKVMGYEEIPRALLVKGLIKHKVFDEMNTYEANLVSSFEKGITKEQIFDKYFALYSDILRRAILNSRKQLRLAKLLPISAFKQFQPIFKQESETRAETIFNFIKEKNVFGVELWESLTPKIKSEYKISAEDIGISGKVDQVLVYPDSVVPIEIKSGKAPKEGAWENHKVQLAAYALLLENAFKISIPAGYVKYVDESVSRRIEINAFLKDQVKELVKSVNFMLKSRQLPKKADNPNKCEKCGLRNICYSEEITEKAQHLNRIAPNQNT
ncbi:CRISPR-associated protein Cas4 [Candidatus Woesearchaeota archaeon]|nr:CRISPR-associated protein Cas4 [Candidatus Woesearchaeota archaeon]MBW3006023.1 CRISPR-associated protein Cas4 [Candidatus Woesearchaeota archaeon]